MRGRFWTRYRVVCLIVLMLSIYAAGQQREMAIYTPGAMISPDGKYLAFFAGPRPPGGRAPWPEYSRLFLVDFDANDVVCLQDFTPASFALAWQPKDAAAFFAVEDLSGKTGEYRTRLVKFSPSTGLSPTVVREFGEESEPVAAHSISFLTWSPDGRILGVGGLLLDLHLSFDGGKSFAPVDAAGHILRPVWIDDETLFVEKWMGGNSVKIVEVKLDDRGSNLTRTVAEGSPMYLCGAFKGEEIYREEHDVHVGATKFFHSEYRVGPVFAEDGYIVVSLWLPTGETEILVLDGQRRVTDKRALPEAPTLIGISAKRKCVYLAEKTPPEIRCYNFGENDRVSTVWKIPEVTLTKRSEEGPSGPDRKERRATD